MDYTNELIFSFLIHCCLLMMYAKILQYKACDRPIMSLMLLDMSSFKAANPDATFEDFIRWHSPGDWEADNDSEVVGSSSSSALDINKSKDDWPPRGRLSKRMSEHGNLWRKIWDSAPSLPASEQKPLLDPNREGEKVLIFVRNLNFLVFTVLIHILKNSTKVFIF